MVCLRGIPGISGKTGFIKDKKIISFNKPRLDSTCCHVKHNLLWVPLLRVRLSISYDALQLAEDLLKASPKGNDENNSNNKNNYNNNNNDNNDNNDDNNDNDNNK